VGTTLLLETLSSPSNPFPTAWQVILSRGIFLGVLIAAAIVSTGSVCIAVARSEIPQRLLSFALWPALLTTLAMALMCVATLIWGLGLRSDVPQLFASNEGMFGTSTIDSWLRIVIAMAITTLLAVISLVRGLSARSALRPSAA
jgi:predicted lysophospholipase L1 biosynthesis ABC-type transport system permease subunit